MKIIFQNAELKKVVIDEVNKKSKNYFRCGKIAFEVYAPKNFGEWNKNLVGKNIEIVIKEQKEKFKTLKIDDQSMRKPFSVGESFDLVKIPFRLKEIMQTEWFLTQVLPRIKSNGKIEVIV